MNKTIERIEAYKRNTLQHAIDKAKEDYHEAELNYRDTGYDRYWNKMQKLQQDISELEAYQEKDLLISQSAIENEKMRAEVEELKKELKTKVEYVLAAIPVCAEAVSLKMFLDKLEGEKDGE